MITLIRGELLKVRSTNLWWIFGILLVLFTSLSFAIGALSAHAELNHFNTTGLNADQKAQVLAQAHVDTQAANLYTAGQYFGLLFVLILGALVVTNEYFHQTATTTFLTTPRRAKVIAAKLVAAVGIGAGFWLVATVLDLVAGAVFLNAEGYSAQLGVGSVWRSILLNLLGYAVWTIVGVGLGALIRSQIATVILAIVIYFATGTVAQGVAAILSATVHWDWAPKAIVALPATASQVMIEGGHQIAGSPPQWLGAVILIAWGVVAGVIGTILTRKRDIT